MPKELDRENQCAVLGKRYNLRILQNNMGRKESVSAKSVFPFTAMISTVQTHRKLSVPFLFFFFFGYKPQL